jgi:hypothetical protein
MDKQEQSITTMFVYFTVYYIATCIGFFKMPSSGNVRFIHSVVCLTTGP